MQDCSGYEAIMQFHCPATNHVLAASFPPAPTAELLAPRFWSASLTFVKAAMPCLQWPFCNQLYLLCLQDSKGGGDGFEVTKFGDGRVALIGAWFWACVPRFIQSPFLGISA